MNKLFKLSAKLLAIAALSFTLTTHPAYAGTRCAGLLNNERNVVVVYARVSYVPTWVHVSKIGSRQYLAIIATRSKWTYRKFIRGNMPIVRNALLANGLWITPNSRVCWDTLKWQ